MEGKKKKRHRKNNIPIDKKEELVEPRTKSVAEVSKKTADCFDTNQRGDAWDIDMIVTRPKGEHHTFYRRNWDDVGEL